MSDPVRDRKWAARSLREMGGRMLREMGGRMPRKLRTINGIAEHNGMWRAEAYHFRQRIPKGRKDYECDMCDEDIPKGERHVYYVTRDVEGPGWEYWRIHGECYLGGGVMFEAERPDWRWAAGEERT